MRAVNRPALALVVLGFAALWGIGWAVAAYQWWGWWGAAAVVLGGKRLEALALRIAQGRR